MKFQPDFIQRLREETPGTAHCTHFNNAGAALMPQPVLTSIQTHLELETTMGGYEAAAFAAETINAFFLRTAKLIHAKPRNIAYASSVQRQKSISCVNA